MELRPALRDERRPVRDDFRPLGARRDQPRVGGHRQRRRLACEQRRTDSAATPNGDLTPDGQGGYSLTSDAQPYWDDCSTRDAVALTGTNIGDELNKAGLSWGWFEGGFDPTTTFAAASAATGHSGQPTSQFIPDEFSGSFTGKNVPAHASNQALCDAVHPVGVWLGGTGQWGYKDDYIPHHEPFQFYASTANPHHLTIPTNAQGQDTLAGLKEIGTDTQSYVNGVPQFNTPNHQYDTSDFDQLVAAIRNGELPASALPAGQLPQGSGLRGWASRLLGSRPMSRRSSTSEIDSLSDAGLAEHGRDRQLG